MPPDRRTIGKCPQCSADNLVCSYNHFDRDGLTIDSWEHQCPGCGFRETKAFRTDDEEPIPEDIDPTVCPYCGRQPS